MHDELSALPRFREEARAWLSRLAVRRSDPGFSWGVGSDSVAIYPTYSPEEEKEMYRAERSWQATKFDAGWGAITWPSRYGGRELLPLFATAFAEEEALFQVPRRSRLFGVTTNLVAPIVYAWGSESQREKLLRPLLRADVMACQLFSEPDAGSDLASLRTTASRDGAGWRVTGQKIWTSGAHLADYGLAICRTGTGERKHDGLTAFLIPLEAPGVEVRPIRQMTGGATFNEVFFHDVPVSDALRIGEVGRGWQVAVSTLTGERGFGEPLPGVGVYQRVSAMAAEFGATSDPRIRDALAELYIHTKVMEFASERVRAAKTSGRPAGPEGSIGKLGWNRAYALANDVVSAVLGSRLVADTCEWGTFAWNDFLMSCAALRIAGGTDEIQKNILGERVLGLPKEATRIRTESWVDGAVRDAAVAALPEASPSGVAG